MKVNLALLLVAFMASSFTSMQKSALAKPFIQNEAVTSSAFINVDQDFFIDNTTGGEWVHFTGQLHLVTIFFPTDPLIPTDPLRIQTNVIGLKGVGETSGLTYNVTGATSFGANFTAGSTNNLFYTAYRLLPPNPIQPLDGLLRFAYNVSFDSFGKLTTATAEIIVIEQL